MPDSIFSVVSAAGNTINYMTGEMGGTYRNISGATATITQLGRWVVSGNNQTHALKIYNSSTHALIDSVTVNCSGAPAGAFLYGTLSSPVNVASGASVDIMSVEAGVDLFCGPNLQSATQADIGTLNPITLISGVWNPTDNATRSYGPVGFKYSAPVPSWTYNGGTNTYTTDGAYYQVTSALSAAVSTPGATVTIPAGTYTYFVGGGTITIPAGITLSGASKATTTINMSAEAVFGYNVGSITLNEGSVLSNITINGPDATQVIPIITSYGAGTWRVTNVDYNEYPGRSMYFIKMQQAPSGLMDHCVIVAGSGNSESIFSIGPTNAWQVASGIGDANAVYVENCTISGSGQGYVNDANDNSKVVYRFNTIAGGMKIDGHGRASNSARGVRRMEIYCNNWTYNTIGGWSAIEARGGKNMIFNNTAVIAGQGAAFYLSDYGYLGMFSGFQYRYQTPQNYPLSDQIGVGLDTLVNATTIGLGDYVQIAELGTTVFTNFGATLGTVGEWFFATGTPTGSGKVYQNAPSDPSYVWGNLKNGSAWARTGRSLASSPIYTTNTAGYSIGATSVTLGVLESNLYANNAISFGGTGRYLITNSQLAGTNKAVTFTPALTANIPASAVSCTVDPNTLYQYQQASSSATFGELDIIQSNRDFFADAGFDTNTGVVVGLAANKGSAVGKTGQGYWATDEGSWNTENGTPGTPGYQKGQGQLYVSNGTTWVLTYTPYTYPYGDSPPPTPIFSSATVASAGTTLAVTFSIAVSIGAGGSGGVVLSATGGAVTWTLPTGQGTTSLTGTLSRTIVAGEVVTIAYTQPGNGIESTDDGVDVATFGAQAVTNSSAVNTTQAAGLRNFASLGAGF